MGTQRISPADWAAAAGAPLTCESQQTLAPPSHVIGAEMSDVPVPSIPLSLELRRVMPPSFLSHVIGAEVCDVPIPSIPSIVGAEMCTVPVPSELQTYCGGGWGLLPVLGRVVAPGAPACTGSTSSWPHSDRLVGKGRPVCSLQWCKTPATPKIPHPGSPELGVLV